MYTYQFTKRQAWVTAVATVSNYFNRYPNAWQDPDDLACDLAGLLHVTPLRWEVENALTALDNLRKVEDGTHDSLVRFAEGDDNSAMLVERWEEEFRLSIEGIVSGFPAKGRTVFVPTMELAA